MERKKGHQRKADNKTYTMCFYLCEKRRENTNVHVCICLCMLRFVHAQSLEGHAGTVAAQEVNPEAEGKGWEGDSSLLALLSSVPYACFTHFLKFNIKS